MSSSLLDLNAERRSKKSHKKSKRGGSKVKLSPYGLWILSNIVWKISALPQASFMREGGADPTTRKVIPVTRFNAPVTKGQIKLLVPIMEDINGVTAVKKISIKKPVITISDIMFKIWSFYNMTTVEQEDFDELVSLPNFYEKLQDYMQRVNVTNSVYRESMIDGKYFDGLEHRGGTTYFVKLSKNANLNAVPLQLFPGFAPIFSAPVAYGYDGVF